MELFDISDATIERFLADHSDELRRNGYRVLKGQKLKYFKELAYGTLINEGYQNLYIGYF